MWPILTRIVVIPRVEPERLHMGLSQFPHELLRIELLQDGRRTVLRFARPVLRHLDIVGHVKPHHEPPGTFPHPLELTHIVFLQFCAHYH